MTSEIDIYRSAHTLIEQHGEGAAIQAAILQAKPSGLNPTFGTLCFWRR